MDTGNDKCLKGKMTLRGWEEISNRFLLATQIYHDTEQFKYLLKKLRLKWNFIEQKLRKGSGLGRGDGTIPEASTDWWKSATAVSIEENTRPMPCFILHCIMNNEKTKLMQSTFCRATKT